MKKNFTKPLLVEVNRIREMMGLSLLVEQFAGLTDFFKSVLGKASVRELSAEEKDVVSKLINNSTEIQGAGIKTVDDFMDLSKRASLIDAISKNTEKVKTALSTSLSSYAKKAIKTINDNYSKIADWNTIKSELGKITAPNGYSALRVIDEIEAGRINLLEIDDLLALKQYLQKGTYSVSDLKKYSDDIVKQIEEYTNIIKSTDNVTSKTTSNTTSTKKSWDSIMVDVERQEVIPNTKEAKEWVDKIKNLYENDELDYKSAVQSIIDRINVLDKAAKDNSLSKAERDAAEQKINYFLNIWKKITGQSGDSTQGVITRLKNIVGSFDPRKGKESFLVGLLILGAAAGAVYGMYGADEIYYKRVSSGGGNEACLVAIPGYTYMITKPFYIDHSKLQNWFISMYTSDEVCYETEAINVPEDERIIRFDIEEIPISGDFDDDYKISVVYTDEKCKDEILLHFTESNDYTIKYINGEQKCGPKKGTKVEEDVIEGGSDEEKPEEEEVIDTGGDEEEVDTEEGTEKVGPPYKDGRPEFERWVKDNGYELSEKTDEYYYIDDVGEQMAFYNEGNQNFD